VEDRGDSTSSASTVHSAFEGAGARPPQYPQQDAQPCSGVQHASRPPAAPGSAAISNQLQSAEAPQVEPTRIARASLDGGRRRRLTASSSADPAAAEATAGHQRSYARIGPSSVPLQQQQQQQQADHGSCSPCPSEGYSSAGSASPAAPAPHLQSGEASGELLAQRSPDPACLRRSTDEALSSGDLSKVLHLMQCGILLWCLFCFPLCFA